MKYSLLIFLLFLNVNTLLCQSFSSKNDITIVKGLIKTGDSLKTTNKEEALLTFKKGLAIALDDMMSAEAAILYKKIGILHYKEKAFSKAEKAYKAGLSMDSTSAVAADLYYNISLIKDMLNQQDSALRYLEKGLKLYGRSSPNQSSYRAFLRAGIVYKDRQLYDRALMYCVKAYNGFKKDKNQLKLASTCTAIGNIQNQMGNHHQALDYHQQALKLEKQVKDSLGIGICYINIANVYDNLKTSDSAIANYRKALDYFKHNTRQHAVLLNNLAITYKTIGKMELAEKHFKTSIKINQSLRDTISLLYNFSGIASLYLDNNNLEQAGKYLNIEHKLLPAVSDNQIVLSYYESQAEYQSKRHNYKVALDYQKKYSNLYEKIYNTQQVKQVQTLQAKFENQRKESEILSLNLANKDAQLLLAEKNENIRNKNLTMVVLGSIILLIVVIYQFFLQRQKTTIHTAKIEKMEAIYQGQEIIKKRIARDLHDIITTNFDGLRLRVLALKRSSRISKSIDGITEDLKKMNQQIRLVSHRLYPLEMYMGKQKFTDIVKSRLSEFQLYGNVFVELEDQLPDLLNKLPIGVQNNLYGILLEVLNNVEKHALATKLNIKNFKDGRGNQHIVFEDNGIGIKNQHREGIGLMNIKQRVEILEGNCSISKTQIGTKVHIDFPLPKTI